MNDEKNKLAQELNAYNNITLQNHEHRSEHWLVAEGEVEVTLDKKTINLVENENISNFV